MCVRQTIFIRIQEVGEILLTQEFSDSTNNFFIGLPDKGQYSITVVRVLRRLLQAYGGGGGSRSQNPHFNPIPEAWLAINSIYLKK